MINEKNLRVKRKYTDNYPGIITRRRGAPVRDMFITRMGASSLNEENLKACYSEIDEELGTPGSAKRWFKRNARYFASRTNENGTSISLNKYGNRILTAINGTALVAESLDDFITSTIVNEATEYYGGFVVQDEGRYEVLIFEDGVEGSPIVIFDTVRNARNAAHDSKFSKWYKGMDADVAAGLDIEEYYVEDMRKYKISTKLIRACQGTIAPEDHDYVLNYSGTKAKGRASRSNFSKMGKIMTYFGDLDESLEAPTNEKKDNKKCKHTKTYVAVRHEDGEKIKKCSKCGQIVESVDEDITQYPINERFNIEKAYKILNNVSDDWGNDSDVYYDLENCIVSWGDDRKFKKYFKQILNNYDMPEYYR